MRADLELIGIVLQVFLEDGTRREVWSALGQRPVRELVELFLDLDTKVRITVRPDAAQPFGAFEDCAVEPFSLKGLRGGEFTATPAPIIPTCCTLLRSTCWCPTPSSVSLTSRAGRGLSRLAPPLDQSSNQVGDRTKDPEGKDPGPKESPEGEGPKTIIESDGSAACRTVGQSARCLLSVKVDAVQHPQDGTKSASKPKEVVHARSLCRGLRLQSTPKD